MPCFNLIFKTKKNCPQKCPSCYQYLHDSIIKSYGDAIAFCTCGYKLWDHYDPYLSSKCYCNDCCGNTYILQC